MKILVVAATRQEIETLLSAAGSNLSVVDDSTGAFLSNHADSEPTNYKSQFATLITGVGMVATAFALGRHLAVHQYDLAINLGIAGSFDRSIELGEVIEVTQDTFTELGAEDNDCFVTLDALGFGKTAHNTEVKLTDYYTSQTFKQVTGATVNTVHGAESSIAHLQQRIRPQVESMEGAAFFYACAQAGLPALQIRTVSNYVEKRNREAWKIGLAVKNLNTFAINLLQALGCGL